MIKILQDKRLLKTGQLLISGLLLWLVFKKIDLEEIWSQIVNVPIWFLVISLLFWIISSFIVAWRWSMLVLDKYNFVDVAFLVKSSLTARFYAIFLPSSMSADLIKWLPLIKRYPKLTKAGLAGSVLLDRIIGFTAFVMVAFLSIILGKIIGIEFPDFVFWLFLGCLVAVIGFYVVVYFVDLDKALGVIKVPDKMQRMIKAVMKADKKRMTKALVLSLLAAPLWTLSGWLALVAFNTGVPLLVTMIIMPVINLVLILPISVAGFGPREGLFIYLFSTYAVSNESLLASSAFSGILSLILAVLGGILIFF